jgi:hypothetical protein
MTWLSFFIGSGAAKTIQQPSNTDSKTNRVSPAPLSLSWATKSEPTVTYLGNSFVSIAASPNPVAAVKIEVENPTIATNLTFDKVGDLLKDFKDYLTNAKTGKISLNPLKDNDLKFWIKFFSGVVRAGMTQEDVVKHQATFSTLCLFLDTFNELSFGIKHVDQERLQSIKPYLLKAFDNSLKRLLSLTEGLPNELYESCVERLKYSFDQIGFLIQFEKDLIALLLNEDRPEVVKNFYWDFFLSIESYFMNNHLHLHLEPILLSLIENRPSILGNRERVYSEKIEVLKGLIEHSKTLNYSL